MRDTVVHVDGTIHYLYAQWGVDLANEDFAAHGERLAPKFVAVATGVQDRPTIAVKYQIG